MYPICVVNMSTILWPGSCYNMQGLLYIMCVGLLCIHVCLFDKQMYVVCMYVICM